MSKKLKLKEKKKNKSGPEPFILMHECKHCTSTNYITLCVFKSHNRNYSVIIVIRISFLLIYQIKKNTANQKKKN